MVGQPRSNALNKAEFTTIIKLLSDERDRINLLIVDDGDSDSKALQLDAARLENIIAKLLSKMNHSRKKKL
jgi:hypothetical protein